MPRGRMLICRFGGLSGAAVALFSALALSSAHFGGGGLPGCGGGSSCAEAAAGRWGQVGGWPVSHIGVIHFAVVMAAWIACLRSGALPRWLLWLVRCGVAASGVFLAIMAVERYWCPWCLATHAGNIALWLAAERLPAAQGQSRGAMFVACGTALAACVGIGALEIQRTERLKAEADAGLVRMLEELARPPTDLSMGFTGRHRLGPEEAVARIVVFFDYQCGPCRIVDQELRQLLAARQDVSVTFRHYPHCTECNPSVRTNINPDSCHAARAAEAAASVLGAAGFHRLHEWLFARGGRFSDDDLRDFLRKGGHAEVDIAKVLEIMPGDAVLRAIRADIAVADFLELKVTPMVFINGLDFAGWSVSGGITRTVEALAAQKIPAQNARADQPATGAARGVQHWLAEPRQDIPPAPDYRCSGPADAPVRIVVFGDFRGNLSMQLHRALAQAIGDDKKIRWEFRHFPLDSAVNPDVKRSLYPGDGRLAMLAEAAGQLKGPNAFRQMHDWLLTHPQTGRPESDAALRAAAAQSGLEPDALFAQAETESVRDALAADIAVARTLGVAFAPVVFVNGRVLKAWAQPEVLPLVLEHARSHP